MKIGQGVKFAKRRQCGIARMPLLVLCSLLLLVTAGLSPATGQVVEPSRPFSHIVADWNAAFDQAERYLQGTLFTELKTKAHRTALLDATSIAREARDNAAKKLSDVEGLLAALGPAPEAGAPAESDNVQRRRAQYTEDQLFYRTRVQQAELAIARARQLDASLSVLATRKLVDRLLSAQPNPFDLTTLTRAFDDTLRMLALVVKAPAVWWTGIPDETRTYGMGARVTIILMVIVLAGWGFRLFLLNRFGIDPTIEKPSYSRRLISAISEGVARGIVPAIFFTGILLRSISDASLLNGLFGEIVFGLCAGMIVFVTAPALVRAVLAPDLPAWQLTPLHPGNAVRISRYVTVLAAISGADLFCRLLFDDLAANDEFRSLYSVIFNTWEGGLLILLCRAGLWQRPEGEASERTESAVESAETSYVDRVWQSVRVVIIAATSISIIASLMSYSRLGDYFNENIVGSIILGASLYLLRGLLRELVGVGMRSPLLRDRLAVSHASRNVAKFWLRVFVDGVFLAIGLVLIAPQWGVPHDELWRWTHAALTGFSVGSIRISLVDIVIAGIAFFGLLLVTRILQRILADRVLPQTQLEPGIQHSVAAGFGYVGIVLAAALGVTTLGIDLSNLAIIAGALSVGIGFGLQNIVNNFVSGLILLIERPIKVGDWVVVGSNEGLVRRISVRATEIQTFQRASVIVPNAEFLSNSLTNWTHKDRNGRIEIAIGVAYGSDVRKIEEILLKIANAHEEVMSVPEPVVLFMNFGASSLDFELRCFTENVTRRLRIASAIRFEIDAIFREEGIEIPFPQRVVHMMPPSDS